MKPTNQTTAVLENRNGQTGTKATLINSDAGKNKAVAWTENNYKHFNAQDELNFSQRHSHPGIQNKSILKHKDSILTGWKRVAVGNIQENEIRGGRLALSGTFKVNDQAKKGAFRGTFK